MSEQNPPVDEQTPPVQPENPPVMLHISHEDFEKAINKARHEGANMLYSSLISYQMSCLEVFANQFKPANASFETFLGFVIYSLQQEFNKKYVKKEEVKDEKDNGKPEAVQGQDGESQEAPKGGCEDVQEGSEGGQEANQEVEQKEEVKDENVNF